MKFMFGDTQMLASSRRAAFQQLLRRAMPINTVIKNMHICKHKFSSQTAVEYFNCGINEAHVQGDFTKVNLTAVTVGLSTIEKCNFDKIYISGSRFKGLTVKDCVFTNSDVFGGYALACNFENVKFDDGSRAIIFENCSFKNCSFTDCSIGDKKIKTMRTYTNVGRYQRTVSAMFLEGS